MRNFFVMIAICCLAFSCSLSGSDDDGSGGTKSVTLNINDIPLGTDGDTIWLTIYEETTPTTAIEVLAYETPVTGTNMSFTIKDGALSSTNFNFSGDSAYLIDVQIDLNGDGTLNVFDGDFASNNNELNTGETSLAVDVTGVGGTITLSFTNSSEVDGHSIYFTVYDSNTTDPSTGAPLGTVFGQGEVAVASGTGTSTALTMDQSANAVFANKTFYIGGLIDMNDDMASTMTANSGDRYGDFIEAILEDANLTIDLVSSTAFPNAVP